MKAEPNIPEIVRELVRSVGGDQQALVKLLKPRYAKASQPQISRWMSGKQKPGGQNERLLLDLAEARGIWAPAPTKDRKPVKPAKEARFLRIPLVNWVSAGKFAEPSAEIPGSYPMIDVAGLGNGDFFATKVDGNSMDRISPEQATVIVNREDKDLIPGKPYIFLRNGKATFKLWYSVPDRLEPFSTDPSNKTIYLTDHESEELVVVGRVRRSILDL